MAKDPEVISKFENIGSTALFLSAKATKKHLMKEVAEVEKLFSLK